VDLREEVMVSVIIPNYNHAPYLVERIESVLGQDYPEIEVILLDDCSTDDSWTIMEKYASDPRVKSIIRGKENSGNTFVQWRKGIAMANGEYIWMAESDDVADHKMLSTLIGKLEEDKETTFCFCQSKWIDANSQPLKSTVYRHWTNAMTMAGEQFVRRYLLGYNFVCNASAVVMRRSAALHVSDACLKYKASGDRQFWIEMALQGKVSYVPETLNGFRQHPHKVSTAASKAGQNIREDLAIYAHYKDLLKLKWWERVPILLYHLRARIAC